MNLNPESSNGQFKRDSLIAGIIVLILRAIAGIAGNISISLGRFSTGARPRLWGATSLLLGIWILLYLTLGQLMARLG